MLRQRIELQTTDISAAAPGTLKVDSAVTNAGANAVFRKKNPVFRHDAAADALENGQFQKTAVLLAEAIVIFPNSPRDGIVFYPHGTIHVFFKFCRHGKMKPEIHTHRTQYLARMGIYRAGKRNAYGEELSSLG